MVSADAPLELDPNMKIILTPGHGGSAEDISLIVSNVETYGKVAMVGDLWLSEDDLHPTVGHDGDNDDDDNDDHHDDEDDHDDDE